MKKIFIVLLLVLVSNSIFSNSYIDSCKNLIFSFYKLMYLDEISNMQMESVFFSGSYEKEIRHNVKFSASDNSIFFERLKPHKSSITNGLDLLSIKNIINKSTCYMSYNEYSAIFDLRFPNKIGCYFEINLDKPHLIQNIWLGDGRSLISLIMNYKPVDLLLRPALINDLDGYTNIRKERSVNSDVVKVMHKGELFFYVQNDLSDWLTVYKNNSHVEKPIGFIHKSRVINIEKPIYE